MKTSAYYRETRFELSTLRQDANGWTLVCVPRDSTPDVIDGRLVAKRTPPLAVHDSALTQEEHDIVTQAFALLETKFAAVHDDWVAHPERSYELIAQAQAAQKALKEAEDKLAAKRDSQG